MGSIDETAFRDWLDAYKRAYEGRDAEAAARLFTPDATYRWGPFGDLLHGPDEIRERWASAVGDADETGFTFGYEILAVTPELGIARWLASADAPVERRRVLYDGIFAVALRDGLCREFREWWNAEELPLREDTVYLFDVDNTLLDNDAVAADLRRHLTEEFGEERQQRYWDEFERIRSELGYADYLGALQRFRIAYPLDSHLLAVSDWLMDYPFADRLYPGALELVADVRAKARAVILSDGDVVFQPRKIRRSGLWDAFGGDVLIYIHKERELDDVERRYPAERYVLVDDKLSILAAVKKAWGERVTTVFPRQGHYAHDPELVARHPAADVTVERIGDLRELDLVTA